MKTAKDLLKIAKESVDIDVVNKKLNYILKESERLASGLGYTELKGNYGLPSPTENTLLIQKLNALGFKVIRHDDYIFITISWKDAV